MRTEQIKPGQELLISTIIQKQDNTSNAQIKAKISTEKYSEKTLW